MGKLVDLTGQRFGRLVVLERDYSKTRQGRASWKVICDCGTEKAVCSLELRNGDTTSCGCLRREDFRAMVRKNNTTHGHSKETEYGIWKRMISRCTNPNDQGYKWYGARGISVCPRWLNSFESFLNEVGKRPGPEYSLDRKDNNGNYEPGNVQWSTDKEQMNNTRRNVYLNYGGLTLTISQWANRLGMDPDLINRRIREGWTTERALNTRLPL